MVYKPRAYRRKRTYKRKTGMKRKSTVSPKIRRYVKKAIHRNLENKRYINFAVNQTVSGTSPNVQPTFNQSLMPFLSQGTAESNRSADRVRILSGKLNYTLSFAPYDVTANSKPQCYCTVVIYKVISHNDGAVNTTDWTNFFDTQTTSVSFQSNALDHLLTINENRFKVFYRKTFILGTTKSNDYTNASAAVQLAGNEARYCVKQQVNLTKMLKKILKFDDANTVSTSDNLWMTAYCAPMESGGTYTTSNTPARCSFGLKWLYEDA